MKLKTLLLRLLFFTFIFSILSACGAPDSQTPKGPGEYIMVVEGHDWGPAVRKVILSNAGKIKSVDKNNFTVSVKKETDCTNLTGDKAGGERQIESVYVSDVDGNKKEEGDHITLVLKIGPKLSLGSPIQYTRNDTCRGNNWVNYTMTINETTSKKTWNKEAKRIMPIVDEYDLSGSFTDENGLKISYADFTPKVKNDKYPLIIWLHGGGEGGTDPTIPLVANKAANYASKEMQDYFDGAYVLVPQSPTAWMDDGTGSYTRGKVDDMYNKALMDLIKDYVAKKSSVDQDRIYVGGCSNGGYMSLKLILLNPDYFAAGYISALAYSSEFITDDQIQKIKNVPIWFIHSKDDPVTLPEETVVPVYERLVAAGASNVHFSYYDHVVDLSGLYGGKDYHYSGHWSWIYSHVNDCKLDYDDKPVVVDGKEVTLMEWMAGQRK